MNPFWSNIFRKKLDEDSLAHFLKLLPFFSELDKRELQMVEGLLHTRRYSPQEIVFEEGDPGSGMYIIRSGRVRIFHRNGHGAEEELALLGPGDFFGETTLAAPAGRGASARTLESAELLGLFRADLLEAAQKNPSSANRILLGLTRILSERLQAASHELRRMKEQCEATGPRTPSPGLE